MCIANPFVDGFDIESSPVEPKSYLVCSPNSRFWKPHYIATFGITSSMQACAYLKGMGGYLSALIFRVCEFVYDTVISVGSVLVSPCLKEGTMKWRLEVLVGGVGQIGSAVVGIFCPPAAYRMDEWILSKVPSARTKWLETNLPQVAPTSSGLAILN